MNQSAEEQLVQAASDCLALINNQKTLTLATYSDQVGAEVSYAPYIRDGAGAFYIYTSELASHTENLLRTKQSSIIFLREEAEMRNPFARERATFNCLVNEVPKEGQVYISMLNQFSEQFGQVVELLRTLPDFHLFALAPRSGRYVVGFGKAFEIDVKDGSLKHISSG